MQRGSEIAAMCIGLVGLLGAAATTGMPMWKVTAFIGENIIVMETRWEGLWMNCYRQANIRMQCKVYDSLLYLPPDLQAARGLMCCSLALSGLGLLVALAGMRCTSFISDNNQAKRVVLMVASAMQFLASFCVFIPVSWTANVIIRDFYNPLLIDAQRRELGEALYIGWVTGACLFASAVFFSCSCRPSEKGSFDLYHPVHTLGYKPTLDTNTLMMRQPISSVPRMWAQPTLERNSLVGHHPAPLLHQNGPIVYNSGLVDDRQIVYSDSLNLSMANNSLYFSQPTTPYSYNGGSNQNTSSMSAIQAVPLHPVFIGFNQSQVEHLSDSGRSVGVYI